MLCVSVFYVIVSLCFKIIGINQPEYRSKLSSLRGTNLCTGICRSAIAVFDALHSIVKEAANKSYHLMVKFIFLHFLNQYSRLQAVEGFEKSNAAL